MSRVNYHGYFPERALATAARPARAQTQAAATMTAVTTTVNPPGGKVLARRLTRPPRCALWMTLPGIPRSLASRAMASTRGRGGVGPQRGVTKTLGPPTTAGGVQQDSCQGAVAVSRMAVASLEGPPIPMQAPEEGPPIPMQAPEILPVCASNF